jgi:hypothetical protein
LGTLEQLVLVMDEHAMGDNPIWYDERGELRPLNHLWYRSERVVAYLSEAVGADSVFGELCHAVGGDRGGRLARRWNALRSGAQAHVGVPLVDAMFAALGLAPFTVTLGPPDVASKAAPGSQLPRSEACQKGHAWTPENTLNHGNGRSCRTCKRDAERRRKANARRVMEVA